MSDSLKLLCDLLKEAGAVPVFTCPTCNTKIRNINYPSPKAEDKDALLASLREKLQTVLARESASTVRYDARMDSLLADGTKAAEALARERELNQELRPVVKAYRTSPKRDHRRCKIWEIGGVDTRCPTCIKTDALLAPPTEPTQEK